MNISPQGWLMVYKLYGEFAAETNVMLFSEACSSKIDTLPVC